ncbi:histone deacetylase family protein [Sphingobacteruim zhuxiongii]|nr:MULTISPECIES: histone deacetylase [unclassified Sphingobacterium]
MTNFSALLKIAHHKAYIHPLASTHRFPMIKYELIPEQLLYEGLVQTHNFFEPQLVDRELIYLAHDKAYVDALLDLQLDPMMIRRIGFPMSQTLVDRERYLIDGTIKACDAAMQYGVAFNTAGGTHHAGRDFGEGFCLLNDQAVAAAYLYHQKLAKKILIIDLDVHQGNGTAHIFENHPDIITFSIHGEKNFPFKKEKSHIDIGLSEGIEDDAYLDLLAQELERVFQQIQPDFVFYQAGVDVLATDKLGKFKLTQEGCKNRDELVFQACKANHTPVEVSMGGGYSVQIKDIVNAHVNTYRTAIHIYDL